MEPFQMQSHMRKYGLICWLSLAKSIAFVQDQETLLEAKALSYILFSISHYTAKV